MKVMALIPFSIGLFEKIKSKEEYKKGMMDKVHINILEFIALFLSFLVFKIKYEVSPTKYPPTPVLDAQGDSTSANVWWNKISTISTHSQNMLQVYAEYQQISEVCSVAEHIAGKDNKIADDISRVQSLFTPEKSHIHDIPFQTLLAQGCQKHLAAIDSVSPARKYQKPITPEFLRCMACLASLAILNDPEDHATDIIIGAYFFAMRSCEFLDVPEQGRTVNIRLGGIRFYSKEFELIPHHHHPHLIELSAFVWVLFEDQKNRLKCDSRTQAKTNDPLLCPVLRLGRAVQRVRKFVVNHNADTPLCTFHKKKRRARFINQDYC